MARIEEATLFRPDPKLQYPGGGNSRGGGSGGGGGGGGGGGRRGGDDDDDGPSLAIRERIGEGARSAKRRKGLSFVVVMICGALTVLGAIFAPRSYEVEARVLVQRTQAITGGQQQQLSPDDMHNIAREYEEQVMAQDNIIAIVRQKNLVARWDDGRQPHRRLLDKINAKLGKPAHSDDEKFDALVGKIRSSLKVWVEATTVTMKLDWSEPEQARDIVDAAVKNFLEARFQSEVGVIPERVKIFEGAVAQAHKDLEIAAQEYLRQQKLANPKEAIRNILIPTLPQGVPVGPEPEDPATRARLDGIRQNIATLQDGKIRRTQELQQKLAEDQRTLADGHPQIIADKQQIEASKADSGELARYKQEERDILNDLAAKQKAAIAAAAEANKNKPLVKTQMPAILAPEPLPTAGATKSLADAEVQFGTIKQKYTDYTSQLEAVRLEMKTQEAAFRTRYKVTHPAEIPAGPKRPVGLIAIIIGVLSTIAAVLAVAALADRFSGIFFEPREVRDRLGLPVFATFS